MTESRSSAPFLAAGFVVLATLLVYANSFRAPFIFDDVPAIVENASLRQLWPLRNVLAPPAGAGSVAGRPLVNLSFALNYAAGGLDPRGYHAVNLLLHLLGALTLLGIVRRTLLQPAGRERHAAQAGVLAAAAAVLWSVHPLLTESVICTAHRTELLGGLCYLLTVYCAIRALDHPHPGRWEIGAVVACLAGAASKEIIATVPVVVVVYDYLFAAGSLREIWRRRARLYLGLAASWVLLGWLMSTSEQRGGTVGFGLGVTAGDYLLTQCRVVVLYLKLCFWPQPLVLDYGTDLVDAVGAVWPQAVLLALLAGATVLAWARRRPAGLAGVWFFVILAPSSSVVPVITQTMAEHRMYLPLAAVVTLGVLAAHALLGRRSALLGLAAVVILGALTVRRNLDYRSALSIWTDTVAKAPGNPRAHTQLARALEQAGQPDEALAEYRAAVRLTPEYATAHYNLGYALLQAGRPTEATGPLTEALRLNPRSAEAHSNLSVALLRQGRATEAGAHLETALRLRPDYAEAHYNLANLLVRSGRLAEALPHFAAAVRLEPGRADAHFNFANALFESGRPAEAIPHYEIVLRLTPGDGEAAHNLALARQAAGSR